MHYRGQNQFAQVTAGQFIDYQPNYASVFFGLLLGKGWELALKENETEELHFAEERRCVSI